jgi:hypothetical protein
MNEEYKTLRELDVQPGDVVEWKSGANYTIFGWKDGECYSRADDGSREPGELAVDSKGWRIVFRASDTPKPLGDMTDAEIGALVRAKNEGKVIEVVDTINGAWVFAPAPGWWSRNAYRVRPEPKRETVTLHGSVTDEVWGRSMPEYDTHRITFDLINGKPDCASVKMEAL